MIHPRVVEQLQHYGHLVKVVDEEPGRTGNALRPSAVVIDFERGRMRAGVDVYCPALALG